MKPRIKRRISALDVGGTTAYKIKRRKDVFNELLRDAINTYGYSFEEAKAFINRGVKERILYSNMRAIA